MAHSFWRNAALAPSRLLALRFSRFATCSGPPSHCRPSAQDKASWRDQASTLVDGSSQFEQGRCSRGVSKREVPQKLNKCCGLLPKAGLEGQFTRWASGRGGRSLHLSRAALADVGYSITTEAPLAKLGAGDGCNVVCPTAIEIFGCCGLMNSFPVQRYLRVSYFPKVGRGTSDIMGCWSHVSSDFKTPGIAT